MARFCFGVKPPRVPFDTSNLAAPHPANCRRNNQESTPYPGITLRRCVKTITSLRQKLKNGVEIGFKGTKYITKPCNAFRVDVLPDFGERQKKIRDDRHGPTSWISVSINEGKFRQVRKMTSAVGFPTLRLVRVRIGTIHLNDLSAGKVLEVSDFQLNR